MKANEIDMKNVLSLDFSKESKLKRELNDLYAKIENDDFGSISCDTIKMAYYGVRQGQFFKLFRESFALSLPDVAKEVGVSLVKASEIENGDYVPDEDITKKYATSVGAIEEMNHFLDYFD
jgi:DNA-binding XRE family transcriptional regulator